MIKTLRLKNWKTHYDTELAFEKGTNVIVGKMGSGKSSVLDAISYALYGTYPNLAARKVTLEETVMAKPSKQESASVLLEFDYAGKTYEAQRIVKKNGVNEGSLRENGKLIAGPKTTDVTKKITEILESDYDLFSRAIYSEQNQIDFFLKMSAAQRKEKLDELLGLDRYEAARSNSVSLSGRIKKNAEEKKKFSDEQKKRADFSKIDEYSAQILDKETQAAEEEKKICELLLEINAMESALKKLEIAEFEHRKLNEKHIAAKSKAESLTEQIRKSEQLLAGNETELKAKMETIKAKMAEFDVQKNTDEKSKKENDKSLLELREKKAALKNGLDRTAREEKNAFSLDAVCPVCKKPVSEHDKKQLALEIGKEKQKLENGILLIEQQISENGKIGQALDEKLAQAEINRESARKELFALEKTEMLFSELGNKKKQKEIYENEALEIFRQLQSVLFDQNMISESRKKLFEKKTEHSRHAAALQSLIAIATELRKSLRFLEENRKKIEELSLEAQILEKKSESLSFFTSALKAAQSELREAMIENINDAMAELWPRVYPYNDFTTVKVAIEEGSYEILALQRNGEWTRVEGMLSGGERSSVAITLRIALSLVLTQNLGWIMLDEPTHNLDSNAVRELSATLGSKLPELIDQIFIITHDKELETAASGKLYVFEREKGEDAPTRIA